jgi:hypothetical protein
MSMVKTNFLNQNARNYNLKSSDKKITFKSFKKLFLRLKKRAAFAILPSVFH